MPRPFMVEFTGTPEAGKTTVIGNISNKLLNLGYSVLVLKESAEKLPDEIPKGTWDANLWMHYQTQSGVLKAMYSKADIVLIDRGYWIVNFMEISFFGQICVQRNNMTNSILNLWKNYFQIS